MSTLDTLPPIAPRPGYLLAQPYIPENQTFISVREDAGEDQKSLVLAVGDAVIDDQGTVRQPGCEPGDVIIHAASNKTFELEFQPYRFVHFTEVHGLWDVKEGRAAK